MRCIPQSPPQQSSASLAAWQSTAPCERQERARIAASALVGVVIRIGFLGDDVRHTFAQHILRRTAQGAATQPNVRHPPYMGPCHASQLRNSQAISSLCRLATPMLYAACSVTACTWHCSCLATSLLQYAIELYGRFPNSRQVFLARCTRCAA